MFYRAFAYTLLPLLVLACGEESPSMSRGLLSAAGSSGGTPPPAVASGGTGSGAVTPSGTNPGSDGVTSGVINNGIGSAGSGNVGGGPVAGGPAAGGSAGVGGEVAGNLEWLPSWATTIQNTEPNNLPPALANNTLRQFVWPTVSGQQIRIQLSNEKGTAPVEIQKVHIAKALAEPGNGQSMGQIDTTTEASFSFGGAANVTIPPGQTVWSDALDYPLQEIQLTSISMQFGNGVPTEITGHPGARETSYIANGDLVSQQALPGAQTRIRWYFINAIEVMAPSDAFAIALLGDSITDGYGVMDQFARWSDFLTLAIQKDATISENRSVLNFGMGANTLTSSSQYQDAGVLRFERDVLKRDKVKWLVVFEGINDINGGTQAQPIIDAYRQIIQKAHEKGILVYGSPITPNGANAVRDAVNNWVRTSGEFDAVIDFDAVIRNPDDPNNIALMYNNDFLHPNLVGYEAMGNSVDLSLFYQQMAQAN